MTPSSSPRNQEVLVGPTPEDLTCLSDAQLCEKIRNSDRQATGMANIAQQAIKQSVGHVIEAGRALITAKARLQHGEWEAWLNSNLPEISRSSISRYMAAAERICHVTNFDEIKSVRQAYIACGILKEPPAGKKKKSVKASNGKSPVNNGEASTRHAAPAKNEQYDDEAAPFLLADGTVLAPDAFHEGWITPDWLTRKMQNMETLSKPSSSMEKQWCAQSQRILKGLADVLNKELGTVPTNEGLHESEDILTELMNFTVTHSSYKRVS